MNQLLLAEEAVQEEPSLYKAMVYINGKTFLQIDNCYQSVHLFKSISRVDKDGNPLLDRSDNCLSWQYQLINC